MSLKQWNKLSHHLLKKKWKKVMNKEMEFMKVNYVWDLVDLLSICKAIRKNRFLILNERQMDILNERQMNLLKDTRHLVAKGYTQEKGADYKKTFSPVIKFTSIHLIFTIVAHLDLEFIKQI